MLYKKAELALTLTMFILSSSCSCWTAANVNIVSWFNKNPFFSFFSLVTGSPSSMPHMPYEKSKMIDITRDKPIKVSVRVVVPTKDHPKVRKWNGKKKLMLEDEKTWEYSQIFSTQHLCKTKQIFPFASLWFPHIRVGGKQYAGMIRSERITRLLFHEKCLRIFHTSSISLPSCVLL